MAHAHTHTHYVGLLWTRDLPITETCICTTHDIHNRQTFMLPAEFEPAITASERPQTHALDDTATDLRHFFCPRLKFLLYHLHFVLSVLKINYIPTLLLPFRRERFVLCLKHQNLKTKILQY